MTSENDFITADETCKLLDISKNTLYGYTSKRLIPHYKIQGRKLMFKKSEINAFIEKGKIKTIEEIDKEADRMMLKQ